jgi:hypothetical protein
VSQRRRELSQRAEAAGQLKVAIRTQPPTAVIPQVLGGEAIARDVPEIKEVYTISGDPDALIRFRVENVDHLQRVVNAIRDPARCRARRGSSCCGPGTRTPRPASPRGTQWQCTCSVAVPELTGSSASGGTHASNDDTDRIPYAMHGTCGIPSPNSAYRNRTARTAILTQPG